MIIPKRNNQNKIFITIFLFFIKIILGNVQNVLSTFTINVYTIFFPIHLTIIIYLIKLALNKVFQKV